MDGGDGWVYGTINWGGANSSGSVFRVSLANPFLPLTTDYDGDDRSDIVVYRPSEGTWYIHGSSGVTTSLQWGARTDIPAPGDYDGDSLADVAVFRPSTGTWFVLTSSSHFTQWYHEALGVAGDVPVARDYDGDGATDLAVFRPSTAQWLMLGSHSHVVTSFAFGMPGDIPVPADYDGVGHAQVAVYRRGQWFINGTNGVRYQPLPGDPSDLPVFTGGLRRRWLRPNRRLPSTQQHMVRMGLSPMSFQAAGPARSPCLRTSTATARPSTMGLSSGDGHLVRVQTWNWSHSSVPFWRCGGRAGSRLRRLPRALQAITTAIDARTSSSSVLVTAVGG